MSGLKYRAIHEVKEYECDATGEMALPSLVNVMVHISGIQSAILGNTKEQMRERGLSWIIIQYQMEVNRMPVLDEQITIETQALSYNRFFTYRSFRAYDEQDKLLVEVITTFSLMNMDTRKLVQVPKDIIEPYQAEELRTLMRQPKPAVLSEGEVVAQPFRVRYLDIDANRHVNNARYLDWIINTLEVDFILAHQMESLTIKYEKEVDYGHIIESRMTISELEDGKKLSAHQIVNGGTVACSASIVWTRRN